jgi:hypothetical protein
VDIQRRRFTIRVSASRLKKGFIAIPQKFKGWFPSERSKIHVAFDDEGKTKALTFHPHDPVGKENRIFGIKRWFSKRGVVDGDLISVSLENPGRRLYRVALDRYVREKEQQESRERLQAAATDSDAERELNKLLRLTNKHPRRLAREELLRIAQQSVPERRLRVPSSAVGRHEAVPAGIRVLLRELHDGKCQLCSFTFAKRNGEPYFEIHHLEPAVGHHPSNLLVVCANCHAQFECATVTDLERVDIWLVSVTINGKRVRVRQPLGHDPIKRTLLALVIAVLSAQIRRILVG